MDEGGDAMTMPRTVNDIDRLKDALRYSQARQVELRAEIEDMRAQRNNYLDLSVMHSGSAAKSAKELRMALDEIDLLSTQLEDAEDRIAELEEGQQ